MGRGAEYIHQGETKARASSRAVMTLQLLDALQQKRFNENASASIAPRTFDAVSRGVRTCDLAAAICATGSLNEDAEREAS